MAKGITSFQIPNFPFSFTKFCLFLLLFILLLILFAGVPLLCVVLILKPKMPVFSLDTVHVESYKLDVSSQNLVVSSVSSLSLRADNPNKIGLRFDPSRFHVLSEGLVVGLVKVPPFHQPPSSKNVTIEMRVLFECLNVTGIMEKNLKNDDSVSGIRILGNVSTRVRIFRINLPKIKVALDCDIYVSQTNFSVNNMRWNHNHLISLPLNSQSVSKKCSISILV